MYFYDDVAGLLAYCLTGATCFCFTYYGDSFINIDSGGETAIDDNLSF